MAALDYGARVTSTDHYQAALDFTCYNARANLGREPQVRLLDWHAPETEDLGPFDLVLAADVLYEYRNVSALVALIPTLLAFNGEVLLADPRRKHALPFLETMRESGFRFSTEEQEVPSDRRKVTVLVHRLWRC